MRPDLFDKEWSTGTKLAIALIVATFALPVSVVRAQDVYPSRPVTVIVPYPPGSTVDIVARAITRPLSERWKQPVVVENSAGAAGVVGTQKVIRAKADGYTLLFHSESTLTVNDALKPGTAPLHASLTPISAVIHGPMGIYVNPTLPVKTLKELVDYAKAHPGQVRYASSGAGSSTHLASLILARKAGIDIKHVPYQGGAPSVTATLSGETQMVVLPYGAVKPQVEAGALRMLAIADESRDPQIPNIPTANEAGVAGYVEGFQLGFFAPPATPAAIVEKLAQDIAKSAADPNFVDAMRQLSYIVATITPKDFAESNKSEFRIYTDVAKSAGLISKDQ